MGARCVPATLVTLLGLVGVSLWPGASAAKDPDMLARLLIPAYIAQNFAVLCVGQVHSHDVTFINVFAEHVKREVTIGLPELDSAKVRVTAADTARTKADKGRSWPVAVFPLLTQSGP
jgi:hypothetical protein